MILCSECFDKLADTLEGVRFTAILPQSDCAHCGRLCLGYLTEPADATNAIDPYAQRPGTPTPRD